MGFDAACFEHFFESSGVFFHIGGIVGDVGNGEEFTEFAHDAVFVDEAIGANLFDDVFCGRQNSLAFNLSSNG